MMHKKVPKNDSVGWLVVSVASSLGSVVAAVMLIADLKHHVLMFACKVIGSYNLR